MKVQEAIELINNIERPRYSVGEAEALLKGAAVLYSNVYPSGNGWCEFSSSYYQLEDGVLGLRGVTKMLDDDGYATFYDAEFPCCAFVVNQCTNKKQHNIGVFNTLTQFIKKLYNSITGRNTKYTTIYAGLYTIVDEDFLVQGQGNEALLILNKSFDVTTNIDIYLVRSTDGVVRICEFEHGVDRISCYVRMRYYKYLLDQKYDEQLYFYNSSQK